MRLWRRRVRSAVVATAVVVLFLAAATSQGHTALKTALFLPQVISAVPVKPQTWVTRDPARREVQFPIATGLGTADLYTPAGDEIHSAVLLFLGVNPAGRNDPRVVGLAEGLARAGVIVMIPWSDQMTKKRVSAGEIDDLVRAYQFLLTLDRVDPQRTGVGGFCVGASFVTVASTDVRIRDDVRFVNFFGGYFDAKDLVASVTSGTRFSGDVVEPWSPARLSWEVVAAHLIDGVSSPEEVSLLRRVFIDRDSVLDGNEVRSLSTEGQTVHRLLSGVDLAEARTLVSSLPSSSIAALEMISPSSRLDELSARVLIMHDREDSLVPSEESRRLARALAERGGVYHTEFSLFDHLDPTRPLSPHEYVRELSKFYMHMYNVLRELR